MTAEELIAKMPHLRRLDQYSMAVCYEDDRRHDPKFCYRCKWAAILPEIRREARLEEALWWHSRYTQKHDCSRSAKRITCLRILELRKILSEAQSATCPKCKELFENCACGLPDIGYSSELQGPPK